MKVDVDYKKLAVMLTPTFLREAVMLALVRVLMQPLVTIHDNFKAKHNAHLYNLAHNGQVCYLKQALNNLDNLNYKEGFEIEDINALGDFVFTYDETEWLQDTDRVWILQDSPEFTMIYDEAEIGTITASFVVYVPARYEFNGGKPADPRIIATVEQYRLTSRTASYRYKV